MNEQERRHYDMVHTAAREVVIPAAEAINSERYVAAEALARLHRTHQQMFTSVCLQWLLNLANRESFDLRNQASVEVAQALAPIIEDMTYDGQLPVI